MKIDFKINDKPFKETTIYNVLYIMLCLVRLLVMMPLIILCYVYVVIMFLLGTKKPFDKCVRLFEGMVFNIDIN